jgi:putative transcriptional regulator
MVKQMRTLQEKFFEAPPTGIPLEKGRLLVSVPFNSDGYFDRTVILLVEHNSEGAMGFILNRPMHVYLKDVLPDLSGCRHVLHNGGPVGLDRLFYLHRYEQLAENAQQLAEGLYFGGSASEIRSLLSVGLMEEERIRFFAGYSGWSAGQLERELDEQVWVVADMRKEYFDAPSNRLWRNVVHTLGDAYCSWLDIPDRAFYN